MKKAHTMFLFTCCLIVAIGPFNVLQVVAWGCMIHYLARFQRIPCLRSAFPANWSLFPA